MATIDELKGTPPDSITIVDIRRKPDGMQIPGSQRMSGETLENEHAVPFEKNERVVLYCGSGNSCSRIAQTLRARGYANVEALEGGYAAWREAGLPLEPVSGGLSP